jgi:tetratricopeptide (TPR) repeat protein
MLGDTVAAATHFESCVRRQSEHQTAGVVGSLSEWSRPAVHAQVALGDTQMNKGEFDQAQSHYLAAAQLLDAVTSTHRTEAADDHRPPTVEREFSRQRVSVNQRLGTCAQGNRDIAGAVARFDENVAITRQLASDDPKDADWKHLLANSLFHIAQIKQVTGQFAQMSPLLEEAERLTLAGRNRDESNVEYLKLLSEIWRMQSSLVSSPMAAVSKHEQSVAADRELLRKEPDNINRLRDVSVSVLTLSDLLASANQMVPAQTACEEAMQILQEVKKKDPSWKSIEMDQGVTFMHCADIAIALKQHDAAQSYVAAAVLYFRTLATPGKIEEHGWLTVGLTYWIRGEAAQLTRQGKKTSPELVNAATELRKTVASLAAIVDPSDSEMKTQIDDAKAVLKRF